MDRIRNHVALVALVALLLATLTLAACGGSKPGPAAAQSTPSPAARPAETSSGLVPAPGATPATVVTGSVGLGRNLIVNGGADQPSANGPCSLAGWTPGPQLEAAAYGSAFGEPAADSPGPADRGRCYLRAAIGNGASEDLTAQSIDVSGLAADIDTDTVTATLGGWFGGQNAGYTFNAAFRDAGGSILDVLPAGDVAIPPDGAALAESTSSVEVPAGTRTVEIQLLFSFDGDCTDCSSFAYADSLSLTLSR
ncbi:MAG: hypothetical protein QOH61_1574 [Chloroflexota bacterium]|jgi:hypothetical protein|nr:hypothetical protein [Chloroflexota bacterium]